MDNKKTVSGLLLAALAGVGGMVLVNTETGEVTNYTPRAEYVEKGHGPIVDTRTFKQCFEAEDWECTKPRIAACQEITDLGKAKCRKRLLDGESIEDMKMSITLKNGDVIAPGETFSVVADAATEFDAPAGQHPELELDDPITPANKLTLPLTDTATATEKTATLPSDMGTSEGAAIGFTEPGAASTGRIVAVDDEAAPTPPPPEGGTSSGLFPGTNIRFRSMIGARPGTQRTWGTDNSYVQEQYLAEGFDQVMALAPNVFNDPDVDAGLRLAVLWKAFYVDHNIVPPDSATARDPNWPNYNWNDYDWISDLMQAPLVTDGTLNLILMIMDTYTSHNNALPNFMTANPDWHWKETPLAERVRMDNPVALGHLVDFYVALVTKYGNSDLAAIVLGEYFAGSASKYPAGFNKNLFMQGRRTLWQAIDDNIPLDGDGNRMMVIQTNPILTNGVTFEDLIATNTGVSQSDVRGFEHTHTLQEAQGRLPAMMNGDVQYARFRAQDPTTKRGFATIPTPAPPNPYGWTGGERVAMTPDIVGWHAATYVPLDIVLMGTEEGTDQNIANYGAALAKWGRNGTDPQANIPAVR